ncbi:class II fructose-bisphosphate aldolase [Candidatus Parcubacteria bacterium]|nr:class II fructose-bisphosphate aldolase [Candidatus Parcubacteria bacterium]
MKPSVMTANDTMDFRSILQRALVEHWAVGQFNVSDNEQLRAVVETAVNLKSPVILGTSEGERKFWGLHQIVALARSWQAQTGLPVILNADHSKSFETAKEACDAGYGAIHIDASDKPFEENLRITKQVVEYVKSKNPDAIVEGELGYLPGSSAILKEAIEIKPEYLTDPTAAAQFVKETGIDTLAVSIGNFHGITVADGASEHLNLDRLTAIRAATEAMLVLHGGSGIPADEVKAAIEKGIVKVNINTELRVAYVGALEKTLSATEETTPYKIWPAAIEAVSRIVEEKMRLFGSVEKM